MSRNVRRFGIMWTRDDAFADPPTSSWMETVLSGIHAGQWAVIPVTPQMYTHGPQDMSQGEFMEECLRHIPRQFHDDMGAQQTVIRYLASIQDLMSLLKEHVR